MKDSELFLLIPATNTSNWKSLLLILPYEMQTHWDACWYLQVNSPLCALSLLGQHCAVRKLWLGVRDLGNHPLSLWTRTKTSCIFPEQVCLLIYKRKELNCIISKSLSVSIWLKNSFRCAPSEECSVLGGILPPHQRYPLSNPWNLWIYYLTSQKRLYEGD